MSFLLFTFPLNNVMKKLLTALALLAVSVSHAYEWRVSHVVDGDTVSVYATFLPPELGKTLSIRIHGVDTPEKGHLAKCPKENALSLSATSYVKQVIAGARTIDVKIDGWDKYGGRVLGDLIIDNTPLSKLLVENNFARPYDGGKKSNWCN
jgi:endonuclease YncB( thermonuclease family)